jgi:4-hydroxybenzoate polyprenyltransferase
VTPVVACVSAFIGAKVFLNTVVFDLRDIEGDKRKNVRTIPLQIGKSNTISLLKLSNILLGICLAAAIYLGFLPKIALFIGLVTVYTHWYLSQIGKIKINFLCDVLVEGEDIVMAALAFAGISLLG